MNQTNFPRILKLPTVCDVTGLSKSAVYLKVSEGTFPKPIKISTRSSGWIEEEVLNWLQSRIAESRGGLEHENV